MADLHPKTQAAAIGGSTATLVAIVAVWVAQQFGLDMPQEVALAVGGIVSTVTATVAAYLARRLPDERGSP